MFTVSFERSRLFGTNIWASRGVWYLVEDVEVRFSPPICISQRCSPLRQAERGALNYAVYNTKICDCRRQGIYAPFMKQARVVWRTICRWNLVGTLVQLIVPVPEGDCKLIISYQGCQDSLMEVEKPSVPWLHSKRAIPVKY